MTREENIRAILECYFTGFKDVIIDSACERICELEQEPCDEAISRKAVIQILNKMDRYTATELTLCDTDKKFPANEVFIVDDVYEQITEHLPPVTQKFVGYDDAISRILKRMWNCRGKHTTSIDKVAMEQIIRDELPFVTQKCEKCAMNGSGSKYCDNCGQKSGKWILTIEDWNRWACSNCGYVKRTDIHVNIGWKYCPNCGSAMKGE